MVFVHCCLCKLTKYDVKLFSFPRNDFLREIWISKLSPHCPEINQMTKAQLLNRKVCIRHFEKKYLKDNNRLHNSCPTLLTDEEIRTGIPKNPVLLQGRPDYVYSVQEKDHNYATRLLTSPQVTDLPINLLLVENIQELSLTGENQYHSGALSSKENRQIQKDAVPDYQIPSGSKAKATRVNGEEISPT